MLKLMNGSIFDSRAEVLVNPVNCVGVMGKGLALDFKRRYPQSFASYKLWCDDRTAEPGRIDVTIECDGKLIVSFPTKKHWRDKSKIEYVSDGLSELAQFVRWNMVRSIAMPMLGCGLGGLSQKDVLPLIEEFSKSIHDLEVELWNQ